MRKVLILAGYYTPSVKGGGPIQSIANIVDNLSDKIEFYILASDRDLGDDKPFHNIEVDQWVDVGKAKVFYTDVSKLTWRKTTLLLNSMDYDVIYLNSFFSYKFSIVPMLLTKFKKINIKTIVLAARGQFSPGALYFNKNKKYLYIIITKIINLYKDVIWHATAEIEKLHINRVFNSKAKVIIANNLTANYTELVYDKQIIKNQGEIKLIFISRIHPKKNLRMAIEFLAFVHGKVEFNIYGPIEDNEYWNECKKLINKLPPNIDIFYHNLVEHDKIISVFQKNHVFLFPTFGENYGHVISEALIGGCPVIISDKTPWRNLEHYQVGWDIQLDDNERFINTLQKLIDMNNEHYSVLSRNAFEYGKKVSNSDNDIRQYHTMFGTLI